MTVGQYKKFCEATGWQMPDAPRWGWQDNHPMVKVTYDDALSYCNWLSEKYGGHWRLPTEAEWEYAARGGDKSQGYTYSGSNDLDIVGWYLGNSGGQTQVVGIKQPNELGIYDMSGSIWEWCGDWYASDYYAKSLKDNPIGPESGSTRVLRGGCWNSRASYCRVARRNYSPSYSWSAGGFRVVLAQ